MKKQTNILIRQQTKKSFREQLPSINSTTSISNNLNNNNNTNLIINMNSKNQLKQNIDLKNKQQKKKSQLKNNNHTENAIQKQKELVQAQTLSHQQQLQICNQVKKTVNKRIRVSQSKIQNDMLSMLEQQCAKLGNQLQKQKISNEKYRLQIQILRKNISTLNQKLQKIHEDNSFLSKVKIDGKMQNKQLLQQMNKLKLQLNQKQQENKNLQEQNDQINNKLAQESQSYKRNIEQLISRNAQLEQIKQDLLQKLQQKTNEAQLLRQTFTEKKYQWQSQQKQLEINAKLNLQKKGQKITKYQTDYTKLQQKLKQQQTLRKKLIQKNKQLQKQTLSINQYKKQQQQIIINLKKRINDLSILKSTNNTIMNQKIQTLIQQNQKLKKQIQDVKQNKKCQIYQKPILFGAQDNE